MRRTFEVYLNDILEAVSKIEKYTKDISFGEFEKNDVIQDAVIKNLQVVGEAVKNIPSEIKEKKPDLDWRKIAGLRGCSHSFLFYC